VHVPIPHAPCWCPFEDRTPCSDDDHFEALTAAVFSARFNPTIVCRRWPSIRQAFADFHLRDVASWSDGEAEQILAYPGMIRNRKKVMATLRNARELLDKVRAHGSVQSYLASFGTDTQALLNELDGWVYYIGAPSLRCYLHCVGLIIVDPERPPCRTA
jgi:3-methyladenine DNA glycosylase Tag